MVRVGLMQRAQMFRYGKVESILGKDRRRILCRIRRPVGQRFVAVVHCGNCVRIRGFHNRRIEIGGCGKAYQKTICVRIRQGVADDLQIRFHLNWYCIGRYVGTGIGRRRGRTVTVRQLLYGVLLWRGILVVP